jgi:alkylation response protein AidB-like acyl-CoA dehydrogenase
MTAHLFACAMPIALNASQELKAATLPRLASGEWIGANAITEAEAGSDVFALKTTATRDGDSYVLSGTKSYVTNGPVADVVLVYASTNLDFGYFGVSAFAVMKGTPGLIIGEPFEKIGLTTSPISTVYLEGCRVPARNLVGTEGNGAQIFASSMQWERACLFAAYVGAMDRQIDETIAYARERRQGRKRIAEYQAVSHRIVEMKLRLEAARLLLYRACWLSDQGADASLEVCLAKLATSEAAIKSSLDAIQIHGGNGIVREIGIERALRDAVPSTLFSGTSEVQHNLAAAKLGL